MFNQEVKKNYKEKVENYIKNKEKLYNQYFNGKD